MTDKEFNERAAAIEQRIGRKPTLSEVERNDLDRPDTRTVRDKVFAWDRKVPMAEPSDPLEAKLQEHRAAIAKSNWWDEYRKSGFDARMVKNYEDLIDKREDTKESVKHLQDHLQAMESELQPLKELRERMRWNSAYSIADVEAIEWAIQVGSVPGHSTAAFRRLKDQVFANENARIDKLEQEYAAKLMGLTNQLEEIRQSRPKAATAEPTHDARAEALKAKQERRRHIWKQHHAEIDRLLSEKRYKEVELLSDRGPNFGDEGEAA